jgi:hypothetical protein
MNDTLLRLTLVLAYGPFFVMLGIFIFAFLLKLTGKPDLLNWLTRKTEAQQPLAKAKSPAKRDSPQQEH